MASFISNKVVKLIIERDFVISKSSILILGITFKENCPDIRNSKVIDIVRELSQFNINVDVYDPHANFKEVKVEYGIDLIPAISKKYTAIILAVSHNEFLNIDFNSIVESSSSIIYDTKSILNRGIITARL